MLISSFVLFSVFLMVPIPGARDNSRVSANNKNQLQSWFQRMTEKYKFEDLRRKMGEKYCSDLCLKYHSFPGRDKNV